MHRNQKTFLMPRHQCESYEEFSCEIKSRTSLMCLESLPEFSMLNTDLCCTIPVSSMAFTNKQTEADSLLKK